MQPALRGLVLDPFFLGVTVFVVGTIVVIRTGYRRENVPAVVNGVVGILVVAAVIGLETWIELQAAGEPDPAWHLSFWVAAAGCLHAIGMLGPYDSIWWWDHLTHTLSAAFVAAIVYGSLLVTSEAVNVDPGTGSLAGATLLLTSSSA